MWSLPHLCEFYPCVCLTTEKKARKNLSQGSRRVTVYVLHITITPTHYKTEHTHTHTRARACSCLHITKPTHRHTHTLQNNIKPPQYKLKQTQYKIYPNENSHHINKYPQYKVTVMYIAPLSTRTSPFFTSLQNKIISHKSCQSNLQFSCLYLMLMPSGYSVYHILEHQNCIFLTQWVYRFHVIHWRTLYWLFL